MYNRVMKNILLIVILLMFFLNPTIVLAKENDATQSAEVIEIVEYELPYPGLLPDNPFPYAICRVSCESQAAV